MHLCLLKQHFSCQAVYIYFAINSAQSSCKKKKWICDSEEYYLKESLMSNLCYIIHGKSSSELGLIQLNCEEFI